MTVEELNVLKNIQKIITNMTTSYLAELLNKDYGLEYDSEGKLTKITVHTQDLYGNPKTIVIALSYDVEGNIVGISRTVS